MQEIRSQPALGVFNIDKPQGMTSHDVVDRVRRVVKMRRVGHAGTLDPAASGVLVVAFGYATRFLEYVMADEKAYRATVRLGITTDTYDLDGDVTAEADASHVSELDVRTAMAPLTGHILQLPPMYSALKVDGQPLYKHARRGDEVLREPREVHIKRMDMIHYASPDVELEIVCSKGTYIRTLAFDLGQALGCGATLAGLRRTRSGQFDIANAIPLEDLQPTNAMGLDHMLANLPVLALGDADAERFGNGARLPVDDDRTGLVRVTATDGATLGVAEVDAGTLYPRKVLPQS